MSFKQAQFEAILEAAKEAAVSSLDAHGHLVEADLAYETILEAWGNPVILPATMPISFAIHYRAAA